MHGEILTMTTQQVLYFFLIFATSHASKILLISHVSSHSHHISFVPLAENLAHRKHDVTFLTYYPHKHPNITTLQIKTSDEVMGDEEFMKNFILTINSKGAVTQFMEYIEFAESNCDSLLKDEATKRLLKAGKQFDAALIDPLFGDCAMSLSALLSNHIISYYTSPWPLRWLNVDVPVPVSYVPNLLERLPTDMDFWQRMRNLYTYLGVGYVQQYSMKSAIQTLIDKYIPNAPSVYEVHKLVDFNLVNSDPVSMSPRPSMPIIADVGGIHCREAKPLPKDFQDFVEDSGDDGFIVFGLGSNVKAEFMPDQFLEAFRSTFSRLKQKVVWKFEAQLENLPKNVKTTQWMPQQDLLGHPKARLFITHAGLLSQQEAIYHGVPIIGIPFFADQQGNVVRMKNLGIGEILDFHNVTAESFYGKITQVLNDKRYYENMKKYSAIFRDQPRTSIDTAMYWIEYVIRHNGARHFRSAAEDLNIIQYFLLDVIAFVSLIITAFIGVGFYIFRFFLSKALGRKGNANYLKKKQK